MLQGNVRAALALLDTMDHQGAPLQLSDPASPDTPSWTVPDKLKAKHPLGQPVCKLSAIQSVVTMSTATLLTAVMLVVAKVRNKRGSV